MAGPAIVVVAGFVTLALAIESADGLVADDYYKQGNAINMTMHRDQRARELGYVAKVTVDEGGRRVGLQFAAAAPPTSPLRLVLMHPTRGGHDREVLLAREADGSYSAAMPALEEARWNLSLEDAGQTWRLTGIWQPGSQGVLLGGQN
jgi:hypothetical protein